MDEIGEEIRHERDERNENSFFLGKLKSLFVITTLVGVVGGVWFYPRLREAIMDAPKVVSTWWKLTLIIAKSSIQQHKKMIYVNWKRFYFFRSFASTSSFKEFPHKIRFFCPMIEIREILIFLNLWNDSNMKKRKQNIWRDNNIEIFDWLIDYKSKSKNATIIPNKTHHKEGLLHKNPQIGHQTTLRVPAKSNLSF